MENSVDKYSSCGVPWTALPTYEPCLSEEQTERILKAADTLFQTLVDALIPICQQLADILASAVHDAFSLCSEVLPYVWESIWTSYPDRHVVHLALHHKKGRVRKKNYNRIMKELLGVDKIA